MGNVLPYKGISIVLALVLVSLISNTLFVYLQANNSRSLSSLVYTLYYSPLNDIGILVVNITVSTTDCNFYSVYVDIFGYEGYYELFYYTTSGRILVAGVEYGNGTVDFFACGNGVLSLYFTAENVVSMLSESEYELWIITSIFENLGIPVNVEVVLDGSYDIYVQKSGNVVVQADEEKGLILVKGYGEIVVTLVMKTHEVETTTTPPTPSTITTPTPTTTPTSPSTPTPEPTSSPQSITQTPATPQDIDNNTQLPTITATPITSPISTTMPGFSTEETAITDAQITTYTASKARNESTTPLDYTGSTPRQDDATLGSIGLGDAGSGGVQGQTTAMSLYLLLLVFTVALALIATYALKRRD